MGTYSGRPWWFLMSDDPAKPTVPAVDVSPGAEADPGPELMPPASPRKVAAERVERRRRALAGAKANRVRAEHADEIQALLRSLPVVDVQETVRGTNVFAAKATLIGMAQPTLIRIRIFVAEGEMIMQVLVPRLRFILMRPITSDEDRRLFPLALLEIVLSRLD